MSNLAALKTIILNKNDSNYPQLLLELDKAKGLDNAPQKLYVKGNPLALTTCPNFAIVGTRKISRAGYELGLKIARDLAGLGFTIVSGLADGGDTAAHQGALDRYRDSNRGIREQKGSTVAVLGTSLEEEYIYPKSNLGLARKIVKKGGALVSEYEQKQKGANWTFPARNRIVAGMSLGVLVLECPLKSGAMITARIAQKLNRPVFAIPGSPFNHNAQGPNSLIQKSAYLTQNTQDIINKLTNRYPKIAATKELGITAKAKQVTKRQAKNPKQKKILEALEAEPLHIDKIQEQTKISASELNQLITELELEDLIKEVGSKVYTSTTN